MLFRSHAGIFPYKGTGEGSQGYNQHDFLASLGFGLKFTLPKDINIRLSWGFPLMRNNHEEKPKCGRFHFEMNITPDFDALLKMRMPKNVEQVRRNSPEPSKKEKTALIKEENNPIKTKSIEITRPLNTYLAQSNKDLAKEIIKPKTIIEFNNIDFKPIN